MTFIDLAIIYLACGAPLSMHYFFGASGKRNLYFAIKVVLVALVWPVAAFLLIRDLTRSRIAVSHPGQNDFDRRLDSIRVAIEHSAFADENATAVFEFRELFARYTGLAQAASTSDSLSPENELFKLSSHARGDLATVCLERKAKNRLLVHADAASEDFVCFLALANVDADPGLISSATDLAQALDDRKTLSRLRRLDSNTVPRTERTIQEKPAVSALAR